MVVVAVAGLVFGCLAWVLPSLALHFQETYIEVGPYVFWSTSPAFWAILGLVLAVLGGLLIGFIAVMVFTARAIGRRIIRKT